MFYAGGSFSGAIAGGLFEDWGGYGFACAVVGSVSVLFGLVYAAVVFLPECGQPESKLHQRSLKFIEAEQEEEDLVLEQEAIRDTFLKSKGTEGT